MRPSILALLPTLAVLSACNGDDGPPGGGDTDTDTDVRPDFVYKAEAGAVAYSAALTPDTIAAHQMSNMFLASVAVVSADEKTMDRLITDGGAKGVEAPSGEFECWERPEFPMWSFDLNFEACDAQGYEMGGGVSIEDHPSGPLLYSFNSFAIEGRTLGGTFALDTRTGVEAPLFWGSYNTDRSNPGPENTVQLGVGVDGATSGATWEGGSSIDFDERDWSMWGALTLRPEKREFTIIHGGRTLEDVAAESPGADVVKNSLNWQECRCPTAGVSTYELDLAFDEITIDLDDLELDPDDIDEPTITIPVDHVVSGTATIEYTGCGEQTVTYDVSGTTIEIPNDVIVAATSFLCDTSGIADTQRCLSIAGALREVGPFEIAVPEADVFATAQTAVDNDFDGPWCLTY
mgnify:CR=1 FL=1